MTEQYQTEMKQWIDNATYVELLGKWRSLAIGNPFFQGEVGEYFAKIMREKRECLSHNEQVSASKLIGWEQPIT